MTRTLDEAARRLGQPDMDLVEHDYADAEAEFERAYQRIHGRRPTISESMRGLNDHWQLPDEPGENWPEEAAEFWRRRVAMLRAVLSAAPPVRR
jgi:hypothetical protein